MSAPAFTAIENPSRATIPEEKYLIKDISEACNIPKKFLEAILLDLKRAGVLGSKQGKGGGYFFRIPPKDVPLARIIRIIDGPIAMLPCVSLYFYERCKNCDERHCGLHDTMVQVRDQTLKLLERKTVADIASL